MILLDELLAAGGTLHGAAAAHRFSDWSYDSRLTRPGEIFIALQTARADGHDYIAAALAAGASGVLCAYPPTDAAQATILKVEDPIALVQRWAATRIRHYSPFTIAVTGSVGKTSTRRAIATLLSAQVPTFQSRRSFNGLLGLPLTFSQLGPEHRFAVLECGSDRPARSLHLPSSSRPRYPSSLPSARPTCAASTPSPVSLPRRARLSPHYPLEV
ncbi:hypothetical protein HC891_10830 [Candidatus Gracilibacteria bacterium]|nr:hypothetical protein [Candidatus Gracilibacteria bacterium]